MNQNNRFVPLPEITPGAEIFGAECAVPKTQLRDTDLSHLERRVTESLTRMLAHELAGFILKDPRLGAALVDLQSHELPCDFARRYQLKVAIVHPDKLKQLQETDKRREVAEGKMRGALLGKALAETKLEQLRAECANDEIKARKYDHLIADIAKHTQAPEKSSVKPWEF